MLQSETGTDYPSSHIQGTNALLKTAFWFLATEGATDRNFRERAARTKVVPSVIVTAATRMSLFYCFSLNDGDLQE